MKFCKSCGANLYAVRQAVDNPEAVEKIAEGKTVSARAIRNRFMAPWALPCARRRATSGSPNRKW